MSFKRNSVKILTIGFALLITLGLFGLYNVRGAQEQKEESLSEYVDRSTWIVRAITDDKFRDWLFKDTEAAIKDLDPPLSKKDADAIRELVKLDGFHGHLKLLGEEICPKWPCPPPPCQHEKRAAGKE